MSLWARPRTSLRVKYDGLLTLSRCAIEHGKLQATEFVDINRLEVWIMLVRGHFDCFVLASFEHVDLEGRAS